MFLFTVYLVEDPGSRSVSGQCDVIEQRACGVHMDEVAAFLERLETQGRAFLH